MRVVVVVVIADIGSIALRQYLVLQGVKVNFRDALVVATPSAQAAQDVPEGPPHVSVPEGVDDWIDEGVAFSQYQAVLLVAQHLAHVTAQTVEQQNHQAGRPAEHKTACRGGIEKVVVGGRGYMRSLEELQQHWKSTRKVPDKKGVTKRKEKEQTTLKNVK